MKYFNSSLYYPDAADGNYAFYMHTSENDQGVLQYFKNTVVKTRIDSSIEQYYRQFKSERVNKMNSMINDVKKIERKLASKMGYMNPREMVSQINKYINSKPEQISPQDAKSRTKKISEKDFKNFLKYSERVLLEARDLKLENYQDYMKYNSMIKELNKRARRLTGGGAEYRAFDNNSQFYDTLMASVDSYLRQNLEEKVNPKLVKKLLLSDDIDLEIRDIKTSIEMAFDITNPSRGIEFRDSKFFHKTIQESISDFSLTYLYNDDTSYEIRYFLLNYLSDKDNAKDPLLKKTFNTIEKIFIVGLIASALEVDYLDYAEDGRVILIMKKKAFLMSDILWYITQDLLNNQDIHKTHYASGFKLEAPSESIINQIKGIKSSVLKDNRELIGKQELYNELYFETTDLAREAFNQIDSTIRVRFAIKIDNIMKKIGG